MVKVIRINRALTFLLPFDRYSLTLSHRLLDSLGGVSRFLLRALEQGLSLDALVAVTGLSQATLLNQLDFLQSHHYLEIVDFDDQPVLRLTQRGLTMVEVERLLQDFELTIWLDAFTLRRHAVHALLLADPLASSIQAAESDTAVSTVIRVPRRPGRGGRSGQYHLFDEASRLRILLDQGMLSSLLAHCWGEDCELITSEHQHWECELRVQEGEGSEAHLPVDYAPGDLTLRLHSAAGSGKTLTVPFVSLPVLELNHAFKSVPNFPWSVVAPPAVTHRMELVSFANLTHFSEHAIAAGDVSSYSTIPACLGTEVPDEISTYSVPPGVSHEVSARNLQVLFSMDEAQLSHHMQTCPNALVVSFNLLQVEEGQPA